MPVPFTIIDGYNVMYAAGMARLKAVPGELERRRNQFLRYVAGRLSEKERERTTVVFDASDAPSFVTRHATVDGIEVLFARPGGDADSLIEELVAAHSAPRQVRVVSSDRRLQTAARRRRGRFVDSPTFLDELEHKLPEQHARRPRQLDQKFGGEISERETERWLEIFGDIPEAQQLKQNNSDFRKELEDLSDLLDERD